MLISLLALCLAARRLRGRTRRRPFAPHQSADQQESDPPRPRLPRPHQQLSRDHRPQSRRPLRRATQSGLRHAGSGARQSIAILDLSNNQLRDFPDDRLSDEYSTPQSYFIGLAFSSDGKHLYASIGSITDPTGEKPKSTGNGIAVYKFVDGQVTPERFLKIAPQPIAEGKEVAFGLRKTPAGTAIPYPAGLAVLPGPNGDRLLVANNLSDNVVLLDVNSGQIQKSFDATAQNSLRPFIPSAIRTR